MRYVNSGNGQLPFITLVAILSISLTVNLPGLGITPIEDKLHAVFSNVTDLEIQLLTVLPNLLIIPFILLSGKLCTPKNQLIILALGLVMYLLAGVMYLFAKTMIELIFISCFLGIGCGFVIPLAASLISQYFSGAERAKQLGMKSGVSNFTIILATLFVGWIANFGWHLAFLVYLIPIVPLCLMPFLSPAFINKYKKGGEEEPAPAAKPDAQPATADTATKPADTDANPADAPKAPAPVVPRSPLDFTGKKALFLLAGIIALYMGLTYATEVVSYYMPFTMGSYRLNSTEIGIATSAFFLAATLAGFTLTPFIRKFKDKTPLYSIGLCVVGIFCLGMFHHMISFVVGVLLAGYGYGIMQPIIYDKTTDIAPTKAQSTAYFSYVLTANYVAIALVPFIVQLFARIFNNHSVNFSYFLNSAILFLILLAAYRYRRTFVFSVDPKMFK